MSLVSSFLYSIIKNCYKYSIYSYISHIHKKNIDTEFRFAIQIRVSKPDSVFAPLENLIQNTDQERYILTLVDPLVGGLLAGGDVPAAVLRVVLIQVLRDEPVHQYKVR